MHSCTITVLIGDVGVMEEGVLQGVLTYLSGDLVTFGG